MTTSTIFTVVIFAVNCFTLCLVLVFLAKWLGRIERKIDDISDYAIKTKSRVEGLYLAMLCDLRQRAVANEQHEEANRLTQEIDKITKGQ